MNDSTATPSAGVLTGHDNSLRIRPGYPRLVLVWLLFFLICLGLGYPALGRYDPARTEGLSDSIVYQRMVIDSPGARPRAEIFGGRILVPYTARAVYYLAGARLRTWNPVAFSMLVASSLFCATTALLLVIVGEGAVGSLSLALVAAALYLLSFAIANLQLSGLIDAGESLFMLALVWSLISGKWWLLPLLGIGGALAKETFVPFAAVFAIVWWLTAQRQKANRLAALGWIAAMILSSNIALVLIRMSLFGHPVWPWQIAAAMNSGRNFLPAFWGCISDRNFWYVFAWLLPLGVWKLKSLPRPWVWAAALTSVVALVLGAYNDMAGTVARPIFDIAGPLLSLSVALLISGRSSNATGRYANS